LQNNRSVKATDTCHEKTAVSVAMPSTSPNLTAPRPGRSSSDGPSSSRDRFPPWRTCKRTFRLCVLEIVALVEYVAMQLSNQPTRLTPASRPLAAAGYVALRNPQFLLAVRNQRGLSTISPSLVTAKDSKPTGQRGRVWTGEPTS
jgi:hypothetical protein